MGLLGRIDAVTLRGDPVAVVRAVHERFAADGRDVPLRLWTGEELGAAGAGFRLVLRHPGSLRALLLARSDLAVGEAYLADLFDVEGSMVAAIAAVADLARAPTDVVARLGLARLLLRLPPPPRVGPAGAAPRPDGRAHSLDRDRTAVRVHYDVGNDFYRTFLDERLVYSCGYFAPEDDRPPRGSADPALDRAQLRKLELVCRKLALRPGERLLDIGCGWGGLVLHAAAHHGVSAVGVTLSQPQADLARERVAARGLRDRVEIRVADYREVLERFDAVASIGMVEHVGAAHLHAYFLRVAALLLPSGRLLNHGITTGARDQVRDFSRETDSFLGRHVFPDGALVPAATMVGHAERAGFEVVDLEQLRPHYARTLEHWVARLERNRDAAVAAADERTHRTWRAYMAGAVDGFRSNDLGVVQLLCARPAARMPLGRDRMLLSASA